MIAYIGAHHTLELNKYCVHRPSLLLHTNEFARQTDNLDEGDFSAVLEVLDHLKIPHVVIYNCGVDAGSSQGHKHLQLFPQPSPEEFVLFPSQENLSLDEPILSSIPPYKCWTIAIPPQASPTALHKRYVALRHQMSSLSIESLSNDKSEHAAYDIILVREWMALIPRSSKGKDGINTNGAGMMGLVWVRDQDERDGWTKLGLSKHLTSMGVPLDG